MDFHFRIEFMLQHVSDPGCRQYAHKNSTEYWQFGNAQRIWSDGGLHLAIAFNHDTFFVETNCKLSSLPTMAMHAKICKIIASQQLINAINN